MITFAENVLTQDTIRAIYEEVYDKKNESKWCTAYQTWNSRLVENSIGTVLIHSINLETRVAKEIFKQLSKHIDPEYKFLCGCLYYEWQPLSLINWHNDHLSDTGVDYIRVTIYLNEKWEWNWGGLFCWKDDSEYKVKLPTYNNAAIVSQGNIGSNHCVTIISPKAPVRKTLQIIIKNKP
jgi:hypothetical protein